MGSFWIYSVVSQPGTRDLWVINAQDSLAEHREEYALVISRLETHEDFYCQMRLLPENELPEDARRVFSSPVHSLLGVMRLGVEDYVVVASQVITVDNGIFRLKDVFMLPVSSSSLDFANSPVYSEAESSTGTEYYARSVQKLLTSGSFYLGDSLFSKDKTDEYGFAWNQSLLMPVTQLLEQLPPNEHDYLANSHIFSRIMQGFVSVQRGPGFQLTVMSRLSSKRAGTRYRSRGIDDDGNVSNFVESRVKLRLLDGEHEFEYVILRGSVPAFWDQQGLQLGYPRIQLTRTPLATQPAFNAHFERSVRVYGMQHALDLLSQRDGQVEQLLSSAYAFHISEYGDANNLSYSSFDVHAVCKGSDYSQLDTLIPLIVKDMQVFSYTHVHKGQKKREQKGSFRVNCLDCLDRTNLVQGYIVRRMIDLFVRAQVLVDDSEGRLDLHALEKTWKEVWADNGDALSMVYTGTGALRSSYTRSGKRTLSGFMDDVRKTATRFYVNNFVDKDRQVSVDLVLGKLNGVSEEVKLFNPIGSAIHEELLKRHAEYSEEEEVRVYALTWNCGVTLPYDLEREQMKQLLAKCLDDGGIDLIVITLQEIVELNATQIMTVDPERRLAWETAFSELLQPEYALLVGNQLVGTTLSVFCRARCLDKIRGVELGSKKTGLGGMAGNKGSIAVRLDWCDTPICLVASHFCAGQGAWTDRDNEYRFIKDSLGFSRGRGILQNHHHVLWLGDLNYRIEGDGAHIRHTLCTVGEDRKGILGVLYALDQLRNSVEQQSAFVGFKEGSIEFMPTYKYDPGTDNYDTSEKGRAPAWTDRILLHSTIAEKGQIETYECLQAVRASDHRPVYAVLRLTVERVNREIRQRIQGELYEKLSMPPSMPTRPLPPLPDRPNTTTDGDKK